MTAPAPPPCPSGIRYWETGVARCFWCSHEWIAVSPSDRTKYLECPRCARLGGEFTGRKYLGPEVEEVRHD